MELVARWHSTLDEIPPDAWNAAAAAGGLHGSAGWLRVFDGPDRVYGSLTRSFLTISRGADVVAVAPCFTAMSPDDGLPPHSDVYGLLFGEGSTLLPPANAYPVTYCGGIIGFSNRLLVKPGLDPETRRSAIAQLVREVRARAGAKVVGFGHLPLEDARELLAADPSLLPVFALTDVYLPHPGTFEQYLEERPYKQRCNVRREVRHFEEEGLRFETRPWSASLRDAVGLMIATERKYGNEMKPEWLLPAFEVMAKEVDPITRTFCVMKDGRMVSFSLCLLHDGKYYVRLNGTDDEAVSKRSAVYFNAIFYEPLRAGARESVRELHFGAGSVAAKVERGSRVRPLFFLLWLPAAPSAEMRAHLAAKSETLLAEDVAALRRAGFDDARLESEMRLGAVRELTRAVAG